MTSALEHLFRNRLTFANGMLDLVAQGAVDLDDDLLDRIRAALRETLIALQDADFSARLASMDILDGAREIDLGEVDASNVVVDTPWRRAAS